jgi:hypothetical protein
MASILTELCSSQLQASTINDNEEDGCWQRLHTSNFTQSKTCHNITQSPCYRVYVM